MPTGSNFLSVCKNGILDLIFPKKCFCGAYSFDLCPACVSKLCLVDLECPVCRTKNSDGSACENCKGKSYVDFLWVLCDYDDKIVKDLICKFKYQYMRDLASAFRGLMKDRLDRLCRDLSDAIIVPVPLHKKRLLERGFNQAEIIAQELMKVVEVRMFRSLLMRVKYSSPQAKLNAEERKSHLAGYFRCNLSEASSLDKKTTIIIIDDVYTTGATMQECAKLLKEQGFENVGGLVLARGEWG